MCVCVGGGVGVLVLIIRGPRSMFVQICGGRGGGVEDYIQTDVGYGCFTDPVCGMVQIT